MFKSTKEILERLTKLEERQNHMYEGLSSRALDLEIEVSELAERQTNKIKESLDLIDTELTSFERVLDQIRDRLIMLEQTQVASYEGAMERLRAMQAFEARRSRETSSPNIIELR